MQPLVFGADDLREIAERESRPLDEVERDCLLVSIAGELAERFPQQLCFKGGFILRHVLGQRRLSFDIDATRYRPPEHKLDADEVAKTVNGAARRLLYKVKAGAPATDTGRSLDFDRISYEGPCGGSGFVAVEVSYRESVQLPAIDREIGLPFYKPFRVLTMQDSEIVAEKVRTLIQRRRPGDLDDLAFLLSKSMADIDDDVVRRLLPEKLKLVQDGDWHGRLRANIESMRVDYDKSIRGITVDPIPYAEAADIVLGRTRGYVKER